MKTNINPFISSMAFELKSDANDDETLKNINSYFINEFIGLGTHLPKKETETATRAKWSALRKIALPVFQNNMKNEIRNSD